MSRPTPLPPPPSPRPSPPGKRRGTSVIRSATGTRRSRATPRDVYPGTPQGLVLVLPAGVVGSLSPFPSPQPPLHLSTTREAPPSSNLSANQTDEFMQRTPRWPIRVQRDLVRPKKMRLPLPPLPPPSLPHPLSIPRDEKYIHWVNNSWRLTEIAHIMEINHNSFLTKKRRKKIAKEVNNLADRWGTSPAWAATQVTRNIYTALIIP